MVKLISEKQKNPPFPKKKSLVRLTPGVTKDTKSQSFKINLVSKRLKIRLKFLDGAVIEIEVTRHQGI